MLLCWTSSRFLCLCQWCNCTPRLRSWVTLTQKFFLVADERMSGDGGGVGMRGQLYKASGPLCEARDAKHRWARAECRGTAAPLEMLPGGGVARTQRG
jgi:hypothetical protein